MEQPNQPAVHVIVLNWNNCDDTIACVQSLQEQDYGNFSIVVVDNGSADDSYARLSQLPGVRLLRNASNLGYAGGNNAAMRAALEAGADYVWVFNNDATAAPDCLSKLVAAAEANPDTGLLSPVIYHKDAPEKIQHCATRFDQRTCLFEEAPDIATAQAWQESNPLNMALWGTALLFRRKTIETVGFFDNDFFAYFEDSDYSMRSCAAGFRNVTVFDAAIWHHWPEGVRRPYYYYFVLRNDLLMWRKYLSPWMRLKHRWWNFDRAKRLANTFRDSPEIANACALGLWHGWTHKGGAYGARRAPWLARRLLGVA
ncbi:MAG TPA: glycosyltransferase family 2 protein [Rhodocyclaceae bacterium]|nr:glycosyltransferase family 2 protein [Rhodocyclaceae bacterium]